MQANKSLSVFYWPVLGVISSPLLSHLLHGHLSYELRHLFWEHGPIIWLVIVCLVTRASLSVL